MKNKLDKLTPKVIGYISVDAGVVWIGDPCYILHTDKAPQSIGKTWFEFCDKICGSDQEVTSFNHDSGMDGLGICTSTKHGDGEYPVIGFFDDKSERPSCVMVDFNRIFSI